MDIQSLKRQLTGLENESVEDEQNQEDYNDTEVTTNKKTEIYTISAGLRDTSMWLRSKWEYIAFGILAFVLFRYVFWGSSLALILGFFIGKLHLQSLIKVDQVHIIEANGKTNNINYYRFGKKIWNEYKVEGVMAYAHIEGNPVYFAEDVDLDKKTIKFAWFQDMSHFEFMLYKNTFTDMRDIVEAIVKADTLHLTLPQVYGYGHSKKMIRNFVHAWNKIFEGKEIPSRFTKIPDEIQTHNLQYHGGAVD